MPLRVTVELIPGGNEAKKETLGVYYIERSGNIKSEEGVEYGNYTCQESLPEHPGVWIHSVAHVRRDQHIFRFLSNLLTERFKQTK